MHLSRVTVRTPSIVAASRFLATSAETCSAFLSHIYVPCRLDTREKDMVEEKFKRSSRQPRARRALPQPAPQPVEEPPRPGAFVPRAPVAAAAAAVAAAAGPSHGPLSTQGLGAAASPAGSDDAPQYHPLRARAFTPPNAMETPLPPRTAATSYALPSSSALGVPTPVPAARPHSTPPALAMGEEGPGDDASFDEHWALHLVGISSPNINEAVEHMKQLCAYIMAATEDRASRHARSVMGASAQQMFAMVNRQLLLIFQQAEEEARLLGTQPQSRGCKYALNVMLQGMAVPEIARGLPQVGLAGWLTCWRLGGAAVVGVPSRWRWQCCGCGIDDLCHALLMIGHPALQPPAHSSA